MKDEKVKVAAEAFKHLGIDTLVGIGGEKGLRDAMNALETSASTSKPAGKKENTPFMEFWGYLSEVEEYIAKVQNAQAGGKKYEKMAQVEDAFDCVDFILKIEYDEEFHARDASTDQLKEKLKKMISKHSTGSGYMTDLRTAESKLISYVFDSEENKQYYEKYLKLKKRGFFEDLEKLKNNAPQQLLVSVQVAEKIITDLMSILGISRAEAVWLYNKRVGLASSPNQYVSLDGDSFVLSCSACGGVHRLSLEEVKKVGSKVIPKCPMCGEPLLKKCPKCGELIASTANKHTTAACGWNLMTEKTLNYLEKAVNEKNLPAIRVYADEASRLMLANGRAMDLLAKARKVQEEEKGKVQAAENEARKRIEDAFLQGNLEAAGREIDQASKEGYAFVAGYSQDLMKRKAIALCTQYADQLNHLLAEGRLTEAEKALREAEAKGLTEQMMEFRKKLNLAWEEEKKRRQRASDEFGDGHFGNYTNGVKKIARILDMDPTCRQAQIWLRDNPRVDPVKKISISHIQGERNCSISWEDDDSCSCYTVCRADGRYPRDPADGVQVCKRIVNTRVTDILPADQPGAQWKYTIFAIRKLDDQWCPANCPDEVVWVPKPTGVKVSVGKNSKGDPQIRLTWDHAPSPRIKMQINRKDSDSSFSYVNCKLKHSDSSSEAEAIQAACCYVDDDVDSSTTYRYVMKQVLTIGDKTYMSLDVSNEQLVP